MSAEVGQSIGARVAQARNRAQMTQEQLAARAGLSLSLIRQLEQERRHTTSTPSLVRLAAALDVTRGYLLDGPVQLTGDGPDTGTTAIVGALQSVDDLIGDDVGVEPFTPDGLDEAVEWALGGYRGAHYQALGEFLPGAVARTKAAVRQGYGPDDLRVRESASRMFGVVGSTLVHLGHADVSVATLREAIRLAEEGQAPRRAAALRGTLAWVLLTQGRYAEAHRLAVATAALIEPAAKVKDDPDGWALYGSLLVTAATATARDGDLDAAHTLLADAARIAADTLRRSTWDDAWGPHGVLMQRVDVELVCDRFGAALAVAGQMPADADMPLVSRCRHLSDVALAQTREGDRESALGTLLILERMSPEYLRVQDQPRTTVRELRTMAARPRELSGLAERMGLLQTPN